jgi:hypothetical protein
MLYSNGHRHAHRSRKFSGVRDPLRTHAAVSRTARPFRVTGLSKSHLLGQQSRRFRDYRVLRAEARTSSPLGLMNLRLSLSGPRNSPYGLEHRQPCAVLAVLAAYAYGLSVRLFGDLRINARLTASRSLSQSSTGVYYERRRQFGLPRPTSTAGLRKGLADESQAKRYRRGVRPPSGIVTPASPPTGPRRGQTALL